MKDQIVISNSRAGENLFHAWNETQSFYIHTGRGDFGINAARHDLRKMYGKIYLSVTHYALKKQIKYFY